MNTQDLIEKAEIELYLLRVAAGIEEFFDDDERPFTVLSPASESPKTAPDLRLDPDEQVFNAKITRFADTPGYEQDRARAIDDLFAELARIEGGAQ